MRSGQQPTNAEFKLHGIKVTEISTIKSFNTFQDTLSQWRKVFYIAAAVSIVGNLFYIVFASATEQSWSMEVTKKIKEEKEINRAREYQE